MVDFLIFMFFMSISILGIAWLLFTSYKERMDLKERQKELEKLMSEIVKEMQKK